MGDFEVVLRTDDNQPRVIKNFPLLFDGTPMPTLYWLVATEDNKLVSRLESAGGVKRAENKLGMKKIAEAHRRYQKERDGMIPPSHKGKVPKGGVGGTRKGVKCLHAHYAWYLAGGDDPVGEWVVNQAAELQDKAESGI